MFTQSTIEKESTNFLEFFDISDPIWQPVSNLRDFDTTSIDDLLQDIGQGNINPDKCGQMEGYLNDAIMVANNYKNAFDRSSDEESNLQSLDEKAKYLLAYPNKCNELIIEGFNNSYEEFKQATKSLSRIKVVSELAEARQKLDEIYNQCEQYISWASDRDINNKIKRSKKFQIEKYAKIREIISSLKEQIKQKYHSYEANQDSPEELKKLIKEIQSKWYSNSNLVNDCKDVGYIEGLAKLKELRKEISYVIDNFSNIQETLQKTADLSEDIKQKGVNSKRIDALDSIPQEDLTADFYKLREVIRGKRISGGWDKKLDYIRWFIEKKQDTKAYLQNGADFAIVEGVYYILDQDWKTGRLGSPSSPCLKERIGIANTLNQLHSYIETSRALYAAEAIPA